jgi:hypothetical protein
VKALLKLLKNEKLNEMQSGLVRAKMIEKCKILSLGFKKRHKIAEAVRYEQLAEVLVLNKTERNAWLDNNRKISI